jgi:hypothetical protein
MSAGLCCLILVCSVFYKGSNIETNSRTLFSGSLNQFSPPEVVLSILGFEKIAYPCIRTKGTGSSNARVSLPSNTNSPPHSGSSYCEELAF